MTPGRTTRRMLRWVLLAALAPACQDTPARRSSEPPVPPLIVVTELSGADFVVDTVRSVRAPEVQFSAQVRTDPNHYLVVDAIRNGVLTAVRAEGHVRAGDTIFVIEGRAEATARQYSELATVHGIWQPWRRSGQFVSIATTLGVIEEDHYWLAIGFVSTPEATAIHAEDPAFVQLSDTSIAIGRAQVEWVHRAGPTHRFSAEVAVEFEIINEFAEPGTIADVIVVPGHSTDSVAAVLPQAIVQFAQGSAVFVPVQQRRYELRWIVAGPFMNNMITVRSGLDPGTPVVAQGLEVLFAAARDSLAQRTLRAVADSLN